MTSNQIAASANAIAARRAENEAEYNRQRVDIDSRIAGETARHNSALESLQANANDINLRRAEIEYQFNEDKLALDRELKQLEMEYKYADLERQKYIDQRTIEIKQEANDLQKAYNQAMITNEEEKRGIESFIAQNNLELGLKHAEYEQNSLELQERLKMNELAWQKEYGYRQLEQKQAEIDINRDLAEIASRNASANERNAISNELNAQSNQYRATTDRLSLDFQRDKWNTEKWWSALGAVGSFIGGMGRFISGSTSWLSLGL